jgi:catechol-2,3-dioxygenase
MSWGLITATGHVGIQTTKLEESVFDATQVLGLRETERTSDAVYLAAGNVHHELVCLESEVDGVDSFGLVAADGDALKTIQRRVEDEGFKIVSEKPRGQEVRMDSPSSGQKALCSKSTSACRKTRRHNCRSGRTATATSTSILAT